MFFHNSSCERLGSFSGNGAVSLCELFFNRLVFHFAIFSSAVENNQEDSILLFSSSCLNFISLKMLLVIRSKLHKCTMLMTSQSWHFSYFFVTKQLNFCSLALYLSRITNPKSRRGWQPCLAMHFLDENLSTVNRKLSSVCHVNVICESLFEFGSL